MFQDTIQKFRKVVQDLQESNQELRTAQSEQEEKSDAELAAPQPPAFNYQIKMVETKVTRYYTENIVLKMICQSNIAFAQIDRFGVFRC